MEFRSVNEALPALARDLVELGADVPSRAGNTKELTFQHFTLRQPLEREIIVPTRKASLVAQIAETVWVLAGRNDVAWLSHYLPRAAEFSDDGSTWRAGYGPRLRRWSDVEQGHVDQFQEVVNLLQADPGTRRAVMSIWDPSLDYTDSKDIPCNNWLHFLARDGVLDLHVAIRSNDLVWGWSGINQFEWSVLLEVVAAYTGLTPGRIHYAVSSLHLYERHFEKAPTYKPASYYETLPTPRFDPVNQYGDKVHLDSLLEAFFIVEGLIREPALRPKNLYTIVTSFTEPMLRSWLMVLAWWWTGQEAYLTDLEGTRLAQAARLGVQPPAVRQGATVPDAQPEADTQAQPDTTGPVCLRCETPIYRDQDGVWRRTSTGSDNCWRNPARDGHEPRPEPRPEPPSGRDLAVGVLRHRHASTSTTPNQAPQPDPGLTDFIQDAIALHDEKDAAYGPSWKKRGEMFSIIPNIARKVDRLGGAETADETSADTAMDLMIYLAKYRVWLGEPLDSERVASDTPNAANRRLQHVDHAWRHAPVGAQALYEENLRADLLDLERLVTEQRENRHEHVDNMLVRAYMLARMLWSKSHERNTDHD